MYLDDLDEDEYEIAIKVSETAASRDGCTYYGLYETREIGTKHHFRKCLLFP